MAPCLPRAPAIVRGNTHIHGVPHIIKMSQKGCGRGISDLFLAPAAFLPVWLSRKSTCHFCYLLKKTDATLLPRQSSFWLLWLHTLGICESVTLSHILPICYPDSQPHPSEASMLFKFLHWIPCSQAQPYPVHTTCSVAWPFHISDPSPPPISHHLLSH